MKFPASLVSWSVLPCRSTRGSNHERALAHRAIECLAIHIHRRGDASGIAFVLGRDVKKVPTSRSKVVAPWHADPGELRGATVFAFIGETDGARGPANAVGNRKRTRG